MVIFFLTAPGVILLEHTPFVFAEFFTIIEKLKAFKHIHDDYSLSSLSFPLLF